ncbi:MAG: BA14K family protein [Rhizobiales bacterium]|nr:BA14K family protein [Hyphomicrobiales bacterium]
MSRSSWPRIRLRKDRAPGSSSAPATDRASPALAPRPSQCGQVTAVISLGGRTMARLGYLAVLMVVFGSVVFGLDWQSAPMSPMPDSGRLAQPVVKPATPPVPINQPAPPVPALIEAPAPPAAAVNAQPAPQIACNVSACARAYRSFLAADCSYQPTGGPRRRCTK